MKEDDVVVVSSDSEEEEEIVWMRKNQNKQYQLLSEKVKPILYYQVLPGYKLSTGFPYARFQELANDLKDLSLVNVKSTQAFIWKNIIRWLMSIKLCYENVSDCINDKNFNLILTEFMAQYVNYKCQLYSSNTDEIEVGLVSNEIVVTLNSVFSGWVPGIVMTLLKIQVIDEYRFILYPIFRKYLSNKHLHETNDLISYLRLILCFRKWKKLAHFKEDKEIINEIAVGKSAKALKSNIIDLSTETADIDPVLPKTVPSVNDDNRTFANITGLIGFAAKNQDYGTRILLINKTLELDDTIEQFFKRYTEYINRATPKLLEWSRAEPKTTLFEDLTRSPSPDQILPRSSCTTQETSQIANKNNKSNGKNGTKAVNQHLSNNCDISSISVNNKFNNLNLNSHNIENLSPSFKNIPQNRNNDVVLNSKTNNIVDLNTNDEDDNNEKETSASGENSNVNSMSAYEKRLAYVLDRLKERAINVGNLINRVNVERISSPVVAAISSDESDHFNAEVPEVQEESNNVEPPIASHPVPIRASVNPLIDKPIRKRHGIVSSTTSFEGTGDDSDNSDDDDGFGVHSRFHFSQRSFSKVVEEATSSTNEIPKTSSNASSQPRRSISSSPCPTRPSTPSPDRWSNISPSSTIKSGSLSRLGIAAGTSTTAGRSVSCVSDGEQPTCSRYVAMPMSAASLPTYEDTSNKEKVKGPPLSNPTPKDTKSTSSINALETSASATHESQSQDDKCSQQFVPSDHTRLSLEVPSIDKSTVSKVDTDTFSVNELLKNISGFIGDSQEEYGFESSKNKCGPDKPPTIENESNDNVSSKKIEKPPEDIFETPPTIEYETNDNVSSKKIEENLSQSDGNKTKYCDFSFEKEDEGKVKPLKGVNAPNVLLDAKNSIGDTGIVIFQTNCTDVTKEKNSREDELNEESETERFIDKPATQEPSANTNLLELNTVKTSTEDEIVKQDEAVTILEIDQIHGQTGVPVSNEKTKNKIDTTEEYSNMKQEIIVNQSKTIIEKSKSFEDEETLFEAIVEDGSLTDEIESPPYEPICQNEILDIIIEKSNNKHTNIDNDDCKKTAEQTIALDQSLENTSTENKGSSSEKTPDKEINNTFIEINECQKQHLVEENKRKTNEKVFETEETALTKQIAKNEILSDNQAQIIVKTVDLNQTQVNTKDSLKCSEDKKLQIEEIIKSDHDYVTVKYSDTRNDQIYDDKLKKLQHESSEVELGPGLETCNATSIVSTQENKSKHREINEVTKLQSLEKDENSYKDTDEKVDEYCQKNDQSFEDLSVVYDTILSDSKSDGQPEQEDIIAKQLPDNQQDEDEYFDNRSSNSVHGESIEEQTYNDEEKLQSNHESLIDKTSETIENQTKEIEEDQCVLTEQLSTSDNLSSGFNNCENELVTNDEDNTENIEITKPIEICPSINQKNETKEKQISSVDDIEEQISVNEELTCNSSVIPTEIQTSNEKDTESRDTKEPLDKRSEIDQMVEVIAKQSIDVPKIDDEQTSSTNHILTEHNAEKVVSVNIEDENGYNKEPPNTSEAIEEKAKLDVKIINDNQSVSKQTTSDVNKSPINSKFNDVTVLSASSTDDKEDEVNKQPLKISLAINKTDVESIEKQSSCANEIEEYKSVTQEVLSDINATLIDTEFNSGNNLMVIDKNNTESGDNMKELKIFPKNDKHDETIEKETSSMNTKQSVKDIQKERLNKIPTIEQKDETIEQKQTEDIKETHADQPCGRKTISSSNVVPIDIQHKTESTADNEHNSQNSSKAEPPKLSPEIEQKVISEDTNTQNACVSEKSSKFYHEREDKMEMSTDRSSGSIISTKNISEVQKRSCSPAKSVNLEVFPTRIDRSFVPPEVLDGGECLEEEISQEKPVLLSLSPSSRIIYKSRPLQFQTVNNEVHPPIKEELRRRLIIRIPKLSILEDELFKRRTIKDSVCKTKHLEEQKQKDLEPVETVEPFHANHIQEETSVKKNSSKKNKSSKKSDRKKLKKAKKQEQKEQQEALEKNICEDKAKESINLPLKDSKITPEEHVSKVSASECITIPTENKITAPEENADKDQNEKTSPIVSSKNATEFLVKEDMKETPSETLAERGEKISEKISKNKTSTKKLKQSLKPNISEEEIKILSKSPIQNSNSLPGELVIKLEAPEYIDDNQEAIDKTGSELVIGENRGPLSTCALIDLKDEATTKQIIGAEEIDENQSLNEQINASENISLIDIEGNVKDNTENEHKKSLDISSVNAQNDEANEEQTVDFEEIHEDQSGEKETNFNKNATSNDDGQDETTAEKEPLKILPTIEQKINFADSNAQNTRNELSVKNDAEREDKIEIISHEILSSLSSTKVMDKFPKMLTAEVESSSSTLKVVDVEPFGEEKMQEIPIHKSVSSLMSSSESIDQSGLSPDQSRRKLIIRIPKLSGFKGDMLKEVDETSSVSKSPTLLNEENSGEYQITQETSLKKYVAKKSKSSKKSDKNKIIKSNETEPGLRSKICENEVKEPIQNSTLPTEEQVCKLESSECMGTQIKDQITVPEKSASKDHKKTKAILSAETSKESVKDAEKTRDKKSTKKNKDVNKREQSLNDLKLSSEDQVLNLEQSKSLTTSIESGDIKLDLKKSVIIEENTICKDKLSKTLKNKKSDKKSNQSALNKRNKSKKDSTSSLGDEQIIRASECISFQIESQNIAREENVNKVQLELNKPKVMAENVIEHKSFVKTILQEYMKESAVKKNTAVCVEILDTTRSEDLNNAKEEDVTKLSQTPTKGSEYKSEAPVQLKNFAKNCFQPKRKQKLNSKQTTEIFTEEPILKKNKTQNEAPNSYEPIEIFPLSILKRSTGKNTFDTFTGTDNSLLKPLANAAPVVKKVKFAECQTEPKSTIKKNVQPCSSKCQKFNDSTLTGHLNRNKGQTNVLKTIVECKDELIKNRNQQVFSQIIHAKQENSIEPDSSSQLAKELQRTETISTEEESNLSTRVQVAFGDLGEPSLISDSEISLRNDPIALESDSSIVFYPSRDSAEDREVSCITSQKNDDEIYYNYNDENGTPVMDEKNLIDDESPSNQSQITSLSKIKVPTADAHQLTLTPVLLSLTPQLIEPIPKSLSETLKVQLKRRSNDEMEWNSAIKLKESELKSISNDNVETSNVGPDESIVPLSIAADENLELWYKKRGISKNRGMNASNSNLTESVENSMENQKNDRKQKKPRRVQKSEATNIADQKSFNFEDFKAAAILTSLKTRQNNKTHRSRKGLQPTRITRSTSQMVELAESFLQHEAQQIIPPLSCSENICEKDPLDNLKIIPSSIENPSELIQSNGSSDSDDNGKLVIDFEPKNSTKSKGKEKSKSKSKSSKKGKGSSKSTITKNKKAKKKVTINPIVELFDDENLDSLPKKCRGRPKSSNDLSINSPQIETATKSIKGTSKQKKSTKSNTKNDSFEELKPPVEKDEQIINKSQQKTDPENKDKLRLSIDVPIDNQKDSKLTDEPNEEPSTSSNYKSLTNSATPHNMNKETWLKNLTLRKVSKSLDTDKELFKEISMVKRVLSEPNLFQSHKTIDGFLKIQKQASENVSKMLKETNKIADDQNKIKSKHDIHEEKKVEISSLKVPMKEIEKKMETLKTQKKTKAEKLNKCIRRLSIEEIKEEKTPKQPKKSKRRNEEHATSKDQTASVTTPTFETVYVEEPKQSGTLPKTPKSTLSKHSELVPEKRTVALPETNVDKNDINEKQVEEIKNKKQIKSIAETLITTEKITSLKEVEKQVISSSKKANKSTKKAINKIVSPTESEDKSLSSMVPTLNEKPSIDSNDANSINNPKSDQRILTGDSSPSTDSSSKIITETVLVDQPKKESILSTDESKLKSSGLSNACLESTIETEVEIPNLKVPLKVIEKKTETSSSQKQLKNDKTNKCIRRLSTQENNLEKTLKQPKKQRRTNEEHTNLDDQTASVTNPTLNTLCVSESTQIDVPSVEHNPLEDLTASVTIPTFKTVCVKEEPIQSDVPSVEQTILEDQTESVTAKTLKTISESIPSDVAPTIEPTISNSICESTKDSELLPENKTVALPETNIDINEVKDLQKTAKDEEVKNIDLIKPIVEALQPPLEISSLNEVDKQQKSTPNKANKSNKKAMPKIVDLLQSGDSDLSSRVSTSNEEQGDEDIDSNDINSKVNLKSDEIMLRYDSSISSDPSSTIFADPVVPDDQHKKKLISSSEEVKLKMSMFPNARLEAIISKVGTKKHRSKSINLEKNEVFNEQSFLVKRLRRLSLDNPKNISTIERDTKNLINFSKVSKSSPVKTPTKKEDEVKRALDISISKILGPQLSNVSEIDSINVTAEEGKKQGSENSKQIIKKSVETFPKRKRPSLDGVQCLVNVSVTQRRRSNSTSDVPNPLSGESVDVVGCEKDQETLKNRSENEAKKARVLSFTNFLELERDFFLDEDEMNAANFNDTREVQSSQVVTTRKAEPQHDCMFSGNRGQDDEDKLLIFNTDLALETVPTYSPDENVDLYSLDDLYLFTPTSTLINGSENVSGGNSDNGEKPKIDIKRTEFTPKEVETMINCEKLNFEEGISPAIEEKQTIDVRTSEYDLNDGTTNISCYKTKLNKSLLVKLFNKTTTPEKKNPNEETMESIPGSKLKSRQKPFWKPIKTPTKPKIVEEASDSSKLESSTSVLSLTANPYPIDDVKSLPVYFEEMFEVKQTKTPTKIEIQATETDLCKVDLPKKQCLNSLSTDDMFDRLKNESPVNTCVEKTSKLVVKPSLVLKPNDNSSKDLCSEKLDVPQTQSITFVSSIPSELCEQKSETIKLLQPSVNVLDESNLFSDNISNSVEATVSYKPTDETQSSVLETNSVKAPCLLKEIDETAKSCEVTIETDLRNIVLLEDNKSISKQSIPLAKNSHEKVDVICEEILEQKSTSKSQPSKTRPSVAVVSSMPSISTPLVAPSILDSLEHKVSDKASTSKKLLDHSLVIKTPDPSDKINVTQPTPEKTNIVASKPSLKRNPSFTDTKNGNEPPSKIFRSETSGTAVQVANLSSMPSNPILPVTPKILDASEQKNSGKISCSKKPLKQSLVIKSPNASVKTNETRPTPENKNVELSKTSLKRCPSFTDSTKTQENPSKIARSEIPATSITLQQQVFSIPNQKSKIFYCNPTASNATVSNAPARSQTITKPSMNLKATSPAILITRPPMSKSIEPVRTVQPTVNLLSQSPRNSKTIIPMHTTDKSISISFRKLTPSSTPGTTSSDKSRSTSTSFGTPKSNSLSLGTPRSTVQSFGTPRSNNLSSSTPKSSTTSFNSSTSVSRTPSAFSADLAKLSADLERIQNDISKLPEVDYNFPDYRRRKSLHKDLAAKQEELNELKKKQQEYEKHIHLSKSHSERKPFDRDLQQHHHHHHQHRSSSQQLNNLKRKHDNLGQHSEREFSKSSISGHSSHVERPKRPNRVYVNKFSELDKISFTNKHDQTVDTNPEAKKLPPWDPKPLNADEIIRTLRRK